MENNDKQKIFSSKHFFQTNNFAQSTEDLQSIFTKQISLLIFRFRFSSSSSSI